MKAYLVPIRAIWLQTPDVIELRFAGNRRPDLQGLTDRHEVLVHLDPGQRMLGVSLDDHKRLGLGRWLRQNWEETDHTPGEPVPADTVVYDEAAQVAYFSIWPYLGDPELIRTAVRRADLFFDANHQIQAIRVPVRTRRRREGDLSGATGYLPTR
jgi:hypothetical protein